MADLMFENSAYKKEEITSSSSDSTEKRMLAELQAMNEGIADLNASIANMSQANGAEFASQRRTAFRDNYKSGWESSSWRNSGWGGSNRGDARTKSGTSRRSNRGFLDQFEKELVDGFLGSDFKKEIRGVFDEFAKELGVQTEDIPGEFGKMLGQSASSTLKETKIGKSLSNNLEGFNKELVSYTKGALSGISKGEGLAALTKGLGSLGGAAAKVAPQLLLVSAGLSALDTVTEALAKVFEGIGKAANRTEASRQQNLKYAQDRLIADVETLVKTPFKILEDAVNDITSTWDSNLRLITGTQGYTKSDLQSLMGAFAERARSEGLGRYVSTSDITSNLATVLQSGLSGKVAEEFAYQATVLGAAIPSQDFFNYASTYASVAANAIKNGKSQDAAISAANDSLNSFANSLLYASRELSGGFSSGLQNASQLYDQAVKISVAARTNNANQIAGVLASVASVTGAVAPDLANAMTDLIYQAATGGNSSNIVALRSLAGINAGNTDFLRAFAKDPKGVFSSVFKNLATMYNSNSGAYMEVAEGFSSLFGMSPEAFQRIDFNQLANAISNMNVSSDALNANMELLKSGQTTLTKEQLKTQQINEYMIEEGLAYILDSEAGRAIQEHMWQEQIAREMMETTYGVNLVGDGLEALELIGKSVRNILNFLNPFAWLKKVDNVVRTAQEGSALEKDIGAVLEATKVGSGRQQDINNLLTRNADLNLTPTLAELLTGTSYYKSVSGGVRDALDFLSGSWVGVNSIRSKGLSVVGQSVSGGGSSSGPTSSFRWGTSKSASSAILSALSSGKSDSLVSRPVSSQSASDRAADDMAKKIESMLAEDYVMSFVNENKTYEEFAASASKFGISDFSSALSQAGYNEADVRGYFESQETRAGGQEMANIRADELDFRNAGRQFWRIDFWEKYQDPLFVKIDKIIENQEEWYKYFTEEWVEVQWKTAWLKEGWNESWLEKSWRDAWLDKAWNTTWIQDNWQETWIKNNWKVFWDKFESYFLKHEIYNGGTLKLDKLEKVQKNEKAEKGDLANALSEKLTENSQLLSDIKDPTIQTNMLLSQILVVVNAIMNQNNKQATISFADSLSQMATGAGLKTDKS